MAVSRHPLSLREMPQKNSIKWHHFPAEIRLDILKYVTDSHTPGVEGHPLSQYATVCSEWQAFFEKTTFRDLNITSSGLEQFEQLLERRQHLPATQNISLRVELMPYSCKDCRRIEDLQLQFANNGAIRIAVLHLFEILSKYEAAFTDRSITLELGATSPSDTVHYFQDNEPQKLDGSILRPTYTDSIEAGEPFFKEDAKYKSHEQMCNTRRAPSGSAIFRLFGNEMQVNLKGVPKVKVVRQLLIRRWNRRALEPETLQKIISCLPVLESIHYEPWKRHARPLQQTTDTGYTETFSNHIPENVKHMTVFEDFNEDFETVHDRNPHMESDLFHPRCLPLSTALSQRSANLESFSASFIIDARHFFAACDAAQTWANMKSIALTSRLLTEGVNSTRVTGLLLAAARAASKMPNLKTMELWNGKHGQACLFRYHAGSEATTISHHGTWDLELAPNVIKAWGEVAENTHKYLEVPKPRLFDGNKVSSHGDAIHHLGLKAQVAHPVSVQQIQRDGEKYFHFKH